MELAATWYRRKALAPNKTDTAHVGFTAAGGIEARWRWLRTTPTLRYTRWAEDNRTAYAEYTKRDQVELLFGFSF